MLEDAGFASVALSTAGNKPNVGETLFRFRQGKRCTSPNSVRSVWNIVRKQGAGSGAGSGAGADRLAYGAAPDLNFERF